MRLSLQTDYSLRMLMYLAVQPGRRTVDDVAAFFQISTAHTAKVAHQLARLGYVRSVRGIGGGLELGKPTDAITIGEIVRAIEGNVHLLECLSMEDICVIQRNCKLRHVLHRAEQIQFDYLDSVRLTDVLPFGSPSSSLTGDKKQTVGTKAGHEPRTRRARRDGGSSL